MKLWLANRAVWPHTSADLAEPMVKLRTARRAASVIDGIVPMSDAHRRVLLVGGAASLTLALAGCNSSGQPDQLAARAPYPKAETLSAAERAAASPRYMALYGAVSDRFPIHALKPGVVPDMFWRSEVDYVSSEQPGSIIVDPRAHYLYFVLSGDRAMRYGVGVGKEGFGWN